MYWQVKSLTDDRARQLAAIILEKMMDDDEGVRAFIELVIGLGGNSDDDHDNTYMRAQEAAAVAYAETEHGYASFGNYLSRELRCATIDKSQSHQPTQKGD